jgi:uncharacterized protein
MKKIALISDSHGNVPLRMFELFNDVDELWHAGDIGNVELLDELKSFKPVRAVFGNIDDHKLRLEVPEFLFFELEGVKVLITHIAGKPGKYTQYSKGLIEKYSPDVFICGHSHILLVTKDPNYNMIWLNPGAIGLKGFHSRVTALRFELNLGKIEKLEAIDFGKRSDVYNSFV